MLIIKIRKMKESKIEIKLPKKLVVHIPTFSDIELEEFMGIMTTKGQEAIREEVASRIVDEFMRVHEKEIAKAVKKSVESLFKK